MFTSSDVEANALCTAAAPFVFQHAYRRGEETVCVYVSSYRCDDDEFVVENRCFKLFGLNERFSGDVCKRRNRTLHVIQDMDELKWISVILSPIAYEVWIGNDAGVGSILRPVFAGEQSKNTEGMKIKLRVSNGFFDRWPRGTLIYGSPEEEILPHLCSRPAQAYEDTLRDLMDNIGRTGVPVNQGKDRFGGTRAFSYHPVMLAVQGQGKLEPKLELLHTFCNMLPNGYAASEYDFQDLREYKSFRRKENMPKVSFRTTIGRASSFKEHRKECVPEPNSNKLGKKFLYYGSDNTTSITEQKFWRRNKPDFMCADLPRTTGVMTTEGFEDMPAMARRPLLCTFGNPPNLPPLKLSDLCNKAAHYDQAKGRCVCNNEKNDARILDPKKYKHYPEGAVCIEYVNTTKTRSIVFILDNTGSVGQEGFKTQMQFMKKVFDNIKNIRVGVVVIEGHSRVVFSMSWYDEIKSKIADYVNSAKWGNKWTAIGVAIYKARIMLENETTNEKIIVLISDGDNDACFWNDPAENCDRKKKDEIKKHPQAQEAEEARKRSIKIIYVLAHEKKYDTDPASKARVHKIVASTDDIIRSKNYNSLMERKIFENLMAIIAVEEV
ncbi:unnamed protein product [Cylicocyclus nassatus]|uniref:VWFA domain-containing protein n=1 Tax=Cylicocyclus nassatus TaxID=53992 RepID=A0AA36GRR1_CYLNA|nr:unnamed protein product [Cylicocyclus nassatus]